MKNIITARTTAKAPPARFANSARPEGSAMYTMAYSEEQAHRDRAGSTHSRSRSSFFIAVPHSWSLASAIVSSQRQSSSFV